MNTSGEQDEFPSLTHHFTVLAKKQIGDGAKDFKLVEWDGYIHTLEDGAGNLVGIEVKMAKMGSKTSGMMIGWVEMFNAALKHGATVSELCQLGMYTQFEPSGQTKNPAIPKCSSLLDYVTKYVSGKYVKPAKPVETSSNV